MRLKKIQCLSCGKLFDAEKKLGRAECPFCKKAFALDKALKNYALFRERLMSGSEKGGYASFDFWFKAFKTNLAAADFEQAAEAFAVAERLAASDTDKKAIAENEFQFFGAIPFFASFEALAAETRAAEDAAEAKRVQKDLEKQQIENKDDGDDDDDDTDDEDEDDDGDGESGGKDIDDGKEPEFIIEYYMCRTARPTENDRVVVYFGNRKDITVPTPPAPFNFYTFLIISCTNQYQMSVKYDGFRNDLPFKNKYLRAPVLMPAALKLPFGGESDIPERNFAGLNRIKTLALAEGFTKIGEAAFADCTALEEVVLPSTLAAIGAGAFENCPALKKITLPSAVSAIGARAFKGCKALSAVALPDALTELSDGVFAGCEKLTLESLPQSLAVIGGGAFEGCAALGKLPLPQGLTVISDKAFEGCKNFSCAEIPESVTKIGAFAFDGTLLESLNVLGGAVKIPVKPVRGENDSFGVKFKNFWVMLGRSFKFVWFGLLEALKTKKLILREKRDKLYRPLGVTEIGEGAFSNCPYLKEIRLGWVKNMGTGVFANSAVKIYVDFLDPVPEKWDADWNGDGRGGKKPYYKKTKRERTYKLKK